MFLIEYSNGYFVDGEQVNWVRVQKDKIKFTLSGNSHVIHVAKEYQESFVNSFIDLDKGRAFGADITKESFDGYLQDPLVIQL